MIRNVTRILINAMINERAITVNVWSLLPKKAQQMLLYCFTRSVVFR